MTRNQHMKNKGIFHIVNQQMNEANAESKQQNVTIYQEIKTMYLNPSIQNTYIKEKFSFIGNVSHHTLPPAI